MTLHAELLTELAYHADCTQLFEKVRDLPWPVLLDSAGTPGENGRYDIIAADPFITLQCYQRQVHQWQRAHTVQQYDADPFAALQAVLSPLKQPQSALPFSGGAIGYFSYDLGRCIEQLPNTANNAEQIADLAVGIYDWAIVNDHLLKQCWLVSHAQDPKTQSFWPELVQRLTSTAQTTAKPAEFTVSGPLACNLDQRQYQQAFDRIKHYIVEGDCYQVNLAKRYEIKADGDGWMAYQALRQHNAAPFSAFLQTPDVCVMSSSPERLLKLHNQQVETKPIKGTRPRDRQDPHRDLALATALQSSLKDRAENLMIVDLLRNDLGKVCRPGSIKVPKPFALESFATVHHLVSTVTGELAEQQDAVSLLRACFPGGSITGAPKLRAMQIIEELEPHRRGVYCGSIAYVSVDGKMDSNIAIRTMIYNQQRLRFWAGGGIVADSEVEAEYREVDDKASAMCQVVESLRKA